MEIDAALTRALIIMTKPSRYFLSAGKVCCQLRNNIFSQGRKNKKTKVKQKTNATSKKPRTNKSVPVRLFIKYHS